MREHIKWGKKEREIVFAEAYHVQKADGILQGKFLWLKAQECLPADRRRKVYSPALVSLLKRRYEEWKTGWRKGGDGQPPARPVRAWENGEHPTTNIQQPTSNGNGEALRQQRPTGEVNGAPRIVFLEVPVYKEPEWGKIPTAELARELLTRLTILEDGQRKLDSLIEVMKARMEVEAAHRPDQATRQLLRPPVTVKPLRVMIIGLEHRQFQELQETVKALPKPVDLRWFDKDSSHMTVPMTTDYIITNHWSSHAAVNHARDAIGRDRVFFTPGGIDAVKQKLFDLCSRQSHPHAQVRA